MENLSDKMTQALVNVLIEHFGYDPRGVFPCLHNIDDVDPKLKEFENVNRETEKAIRTLCSYYVPSIWEDVIKEKSEIERWSGFVSGFNTGMNKSFLLLKDWQYFLDVNPDSVREICSQYFLFHEDIAMRPIGGKEYNERITDLFKKLLHEIIQTIKDELSNEDPEEDEESRKYSYYFLQNIKNKLKSCPEEILEQKELFKS
jgi:hypothetical protein